MVRNWLLGLVLGGVCPWYRHCPFLSLLRPMVSPPLTPCLPPSSQQCPQSHLWFLRL